MPLSSVFDEHVHTPTAHLTRRARRNR